MQSTPQTPLNLSVHATENLETRHQNSWSRHAKKAAKQRVGYLVAKKWLQYNVSLTSINCLI